MNDIIAKMNKTQTQNWIKVFIIAIVVYTGFCIAIMNSRYDSLSRYPYDDKYSSELIKKYLTREEIEYIIEYSIAPNVFITFIQEDGFNIYHAAEYKKLSENVWQESPKRIVQMVEETRNDMDVDTLIAFLNHYTYEELKAFLDNGDQYAKGTVLVENAQNVDVYLDDSHTIGRHTPFYLQQIAEMIPTVNQKTIIVDEKIQEPLQELCSAINVAMKSQQGCGGLQVNRAYVSYEEQERMYLESVEKIGEEATLKEMNYPGHDEHQLGLAIDFQVVGLEDSLFSLSEQADWLKENAWAYGFMNTYSELDQNVTGKQAKPYHYRYVGSELARLLHDTNTTFAHYMSKK